MKRIGRVPVGCSGWQYQHWRGDFYPTERPTSRWFAHYALTFDTVEVNNSFHRLPEAETFATWRDQAPPRFVYAVKASRFLTHMNASRSSCGRSPRSCPPPPKAPARPRRSARATAGPRGFDTSSNSASRAGTTIGCSRCWNTIGSHFVCTICRAPRPIKSSSVPSSTPASTSVRRNTAVATTIGGSTSGPGGSPIARRAVSRCLRTSTTTPAATHRAMRSG